jgi:hypothetical protein
MDRYTNLQVCVSLIKVYGHRSDWSAKVQAPARILYKSRYPQIMKAHAINLVIIHRGCVTDVV